jgi:hypothetical protein
MPASDDIVLNKVATIERCDFLLFARIVLQSKP